jgi:hypothetical protein
MAGAFWTPEEDLKLRELTVSCTTHEIAQIIGRSRKGVIRRMNRLGVAVRWKVGRGGLKTKLWFPEDDRKLYGLTHLTQKKAAKRLNVRLVSLQKRAQKLGIKWSQGRQNPSSLAKLMGITRRRVYCFVKKRGMGHKSRGVGGYYNLTDDEVAAVLGGFREGRLYLRQQEYAE